MPEKLEELRQRLQDATVPGFLDRLLDRGMARGMVWEDGVLPPGAPGFSRQLDRKSPRTTRIPLLQWLCGYGHLNLALPFLSKRFARQVRL